MNTANYINLIYRTVADLNTEHGVCLVQNRMTKKIYVKKRTALYCKPVYQWLFEHPVKGVPHIYEIQEQDNALVIVEEYISGSTLQELLDEQGVLQEKEVISLILQLSHILLQLHHAEPPIIHRDIKPDNLMLSPDGQLYLLDFDAAKQIRSDKAKSKNKEWSKDTHLIGTEGFAAPEQYGFGLSDVRTDLFAIGVLMNVLLTEELPSERMAEGLLQSTIQKCTMLMPQKRYANLEQLQSELKYLEIAALLSHPTSRWSALRAIGKNIGSIARIAICAIAMFLGTFVDFVGTSSRAERLYYAVITELALFGMCAVTMNFFDIHRSLPLMKSKNYLLRALGVVLADLLILIVLEVTVTAGATALFG